MNRDFENLAARAAPAIFVVLWSTGFIATKYVLHNAEPLTYLAIRMALVVGLMAIIVAIARPVWPNRSEIGHSIVAGILVHGFYLGGTAVAISLSIPAGLSALIPGLQPILTSTLANRWLGERVTPLQWTGLLLGLAGVVLILHDRPMSGQAGWGWLASGVSLVSITLGTLYQRRYCNRIDWRSGNLVQYVAVTVFFGAAAWLFESNVVHWTQEFVLSLVWLAVVLSIGSIGLLYWLIRRQAATSVASLFYLVPAVTAVMAYVLFDERLDTIAIIGMVACAAAVFLVNRRGVSLTGALRKQKPPGFHPEAFVRDAGGDQRFDFLAFFFFFGGFLRGLLDGLFGRLFRRGFLASFLAGLLGLLGFLLRRRLGHRFLGGFLGLPGGLLDLLDHRLGGFRGRRCGTAHRIRHLFENRFIVVHVVPQCCRSRNDSRILKCVKRTPRRAQPRRVFA